MNGGIYVQKISLSGPLSNKKSGLLQPPTASVPPFAFRLHPSLGALGGSGTHRKHSWEQGLEFTR